MSNGFVTARSACQCEHSRCHHPYLSVPAGRRKAIFVGAVCDRCADSHYADVLTTKSKARA